MVRREIIRDACGSARLNQFVQNTSFIMLVRALFRWVAGHSTLMKYALSQDIKVYGHNNLCESRRASSEINFNSTFYEAGGR